MSISFLLLLGMSPSDIFHGRILSFQEFPNPLVVHFGRKVVVTFG
jgi:hypothetical protein